MGNRSIIELVRCYGGPVSHAALDPTNSIFQDGDIEGLITYRVIKCCAVVFGDPVCAPEIKVALLDAYTVYCNDNELSTIFATWHWVAMPINSASVSLLASMIA